MESIRKIAKLLSSKATIEGAGVHLNRVFGYHNLPLFDPFLLLDDFHSDDPQQYKQGFPWHPHRGIETITYILKGKVAHGDSLGNKGVIESGDVQWMTAGSGIIHQEMPAGDDNQDLWGFQLWANLPAAQKMMSPRYREIKAAKIPESNRYNGIKIKVICGDVDGVYGPVRDIMIDPEFLDVTIPPTTDFDHPVTLGYKVFAYVLSGRGIFEQAPGDGSVEDYLIGPGKLVLYGDGGNVKISTGPDTVRFLLISGKPLNEPVSWYGPIVMNTKEQLKTAFAEYEQNEFLKHKAIK